MKTRRYSSVLLFQWIIAIIVKGSKTKNLKIFRTLCRQTVTQTWLCSPSPPLTKVMQILLRSLRNVYSIAPSLVSLF